MKNQLLIKAAAISSIFAATSAQGVTLTWDDGGIGSEFSTAENWDTDTAPTNADDAVIDGSFTVERSVDATVDRTFVQGGATLNVTAGSHSDDRAGNTIRTFIGNGSTGTVNMSGSSIWNIGHILVVGSGNGGNGTFNLSGGELNVSRDSNALAGAPVKSSLSIGTGNATGLMNITGGRLITRAGVEVNTGGTFQVVGTGASEIGIGSSGSLDGYWFHNSGGILRMDIGAAGVTKILIDEVDGDAGQFVTFADGAILDLGFTGIPETGGTWTLMELENADMVDNGLELAAGDEAAGWSFNIDNSGTNALLTATFVPEPSSAVLLGIGGLALICRRRK